MRTILVAALASLVAACQPQATERADSTPPPPAAGGAAATPDTTREVGLRTDRASYRASDPVTLTIVNRGSASWSFNPCFRTVEREGADGWDAVAEPDRVCTMEAWILGPGETRTATTDLPSSLASGRYRLALSLTPERQDTSATSLRATTAPFTVER